MKKILIALVACLSLSAFANEVICLDSAGKTAFSMDDDSFTHYYGDAGRTSYLTKYNDASGIVHTKSGFSITGINFYYNLDAVAKVNVKKKTVTIEETSPRGHKVELIKCDRLEVNI